MRTPPHPIFKGSPSANRQKHRPFLMQRRVNSNSPPNILKILCCTNLPKYSKIRCCTQPFLKQLFVSSVETWEDPLEPSSFRYFFDPRHPWQHSSCHLHTSLFTRFAVMKTFSCTSIPFRSFLPVTANFGPGKKRNSDDDWQFTLSAILRSFHSLSPSSFETWLLYAMQALNRFPILAQTFIPGICTSKRQFER